MFRCLIFPLLLLATRANAEIHSMTLRQAVEMAVRQNPDLTLARLDEEKTREGIHVAKDPFIPRITVGSGLAYSNGFPMSIDGSAPSIVQARASQFIFNRPQQLAIAQAREDTRGAGLALSGKREEVAYRVATLFLDAERAARIGVLARKDAESQQQMLSIVRAQVSEGRALPLAEKTAALELARSRQMAASIDADQATLETNLALVLGLSAADRVRPATVDRPIPEFPKSEEQAVQAAVASNKDLRRIESQIASKQLEIRGVSAERWPRVDLVAQYGMLARFNNYDEFFRKFQRNNGEIGMSFQLPLPLGPGIGSRMAQSRTDVAHLRVELTATRNRLAADTQQAYREVTKAQGAAEVARLDLDVAREQLSVNLARMQEGRLNLREVEESRIAEDQKWIAFYDAQYALEKARWNMLRLTGTLAATLAPAGAAQ
jgi:outer membrane protein TolC